MNSSTLSPAGNSLHVVLGAGPVGRATAAALRADGHRVRMVNRSGRLVEAPEGVELCAADLYKPESVREVTAGAAAVYQAAQPGYTEWTEKFPPLITSILSGLEGSGSSLIMADNLYMYGEVSGPLHEDLPNTATTRKGRVRAALSEMLLDAHRSGRVPVAIARASDFFGPWALDSAVGDRVFYPALSGKAAQFGGNLDQPHSFTYVGDFGRTLAVLGTHEAALGGIWHVPNDRPQTTQREFAALLYAETGHPLKVSSVGKTMMRIVGLFVPEAGEVVEMMYEFDKPFVVESRKVADAFGLGATPMEQALRETVAWYRTHPHSKAHVA